MSDVSVLREFLVKLGFDIDKAKFEKFTKSVETATKRVAEVGVAISAAAVAVEAGVAKIAAQFDDIYYASQRLRSSAENIQAFGFGISQVGGTAEGARSALEGLADFMRSNYGGEALLRGWGIATRDANGQLKQTTSIMDELALKFRAMKAGGQYPLAKSEAEMLGIDEATLQAMIRGPDIYEAQLHAFAKQIGLDMGKGSDSAQAFMKQIRTLKMEIGLVFEKVALDLIQRHGPEIERFLVWVANNAPEIADRVERFADQIIRWGERIFSFAERVYEFLKGLDKATNGWSTKFLEWGILLKATGIFDLGLALFGLIPAIRTIVGLTRGAAAVTGAGAAETGATGAAGAAAGGGIALPALALLVGGVLGVNWLTDRDKDLVAYKAVLANIHTASNEQLAMAARHIYDSVKQTPAGLAGAPLVKRFDDQARAISAELARRHADTAASGVVGDPDNQPRAGVKATRDLVTTMRALGDGLRDFTDQLTKPTGSSTGPLGAPANDDTPAPGGHDVTVGNPGARIQQVAGMLQKGGLSLANALGAAAIMAAESGLRPDAYNPISGGKTHAQGIAQWLGKRLDTFRQVMGTDVRRATLEQQVQFVLWELQHTHKSALAALLGQSTVGGSMDVFSRLFEGANRAGYLQDMHAGAGMLAGGHRRHLGGNQYAGAPHSLHQKTDINIHGVTDPHAAGREVLASQARVNGDMVRNLKTAIA